MVLDSPRTLLLPVMLGKTFPQKGLNTVFFFQFSGSLGFDSPFHILSLFLAMDVFEKEFAFQRWEMVAMAI